MNSVTREKTKKLVLFSVMSALILVMGFTPIGYIKFMTIEITFLTIPVVITAILLGPYCGAAAGGLFGITSLIQAVSGYSPFGLALFTLNPFYAVLMCIVPRILIGLLSGYMFLFLKKFDKKSTWSIIVSTIFGAIVNTVLFTALFLIFYRNATIESLSLDLSKLSVFKVIGLLVTTNAVIEIVVCGIVGAAVSKAVMYFIGGKSK